MKSELKNKPLYVSSIELRQNPPLEPGERFPHEPLTFLPTRNSYTLTIELEEGFSGVPREQRQDLADTIEILQKALSPGPQYEKGNGHRITNASDVPWERLISMRDEAERVMKSYTNQVESLLDRTMYTKNHQAERELSEITPVEEHWGSVLKSLNTEIERRLEKSLEYVEKNQR